MSNEHGAIKELIQAAKEIAGELLITGFSGLEITEETATFLKDAQIGGVLLFAHNFENPAQAAELSNQIQECRSKLPLWISVDHEGGRVQRFKKGFSRIPDAAAIGATESPQLAFEISEIIAQELKAVGINLNFCPIADIATNPKNPVIGNRSFGSSEDSVAKMVAATIRGHLVHGIQPCVKHFPGHGDTSTDSHYALPRIDTPLETLQKREFIPFIKAFRTKCHMVMSAHILNAQLDPQWPATLSSHILQEVLRTQLGYAGVIVSDDMEMKAITDHFGAEDAPIRAIQAGCDLLLYRTEAACRNAHRAILRALDDHSLSAERVLESVDRLRALKRSVLQPYRPVSIAHVGRQLALPQYQEVIQRIEAGK
jgi:beta-N-acetylhexosaminidase